MRAEAATVQVRAEHSLKLERSDGSQARSRCFACLCVAAVKGFFFFLVTVSIGSSVFNPETQNMKLLNTNRISQVENCTPGTFVSYKNYQTAS